ncbi:MAG: hypothetical protein GKR91_09285 [Pseudomonadales bacterium]|nr:hypothetical protein [Pseudomonadales bacterium]
MFRHCFALILSLIMLPALSAENPDVRELMTAEEFAASGLSRLSSEEIEAINSWLVRYTADDAEEFASSSPAVREINNADISSKIDGEFNGWNGPTRFHLQNGQIWETNSSRTYRYSALNPEVEITRYWPGIYRMRIVDTGQTIQVRRVE